MTSRNPKSWKIFIRTKKADLRRAGTPDTEVNTIIASEYARLEAASVAPQVEKKQKRKAAKAKKISKK